MDQWGIKNKMGSWGKVRWGGVNRNGFLGPKQSNMPNRIMTFHWPHKPISTHPQHCIHANETKRATHEPTFQSYNHEIFLLSSARDILSKHGAIKCGMRNHFEFASILREKPRIRQTRTKEIKPRIRIEFKFLTKSNSNTETKFILTCEEEKTKGRNSLPDSTHQVIPLSSSSSTILLFAPSRSSLYCIFESCVLFNDEEWNIEFNLKMVFWFSFKFIFLAIWCFYALLMLWFFSLCSLCYSVRNLSPPIILYFCLLFVGILFKWCEEVENFYWEVVRGWRYQFWYGVLEWKNSVSWLKVGS